ncbi:DgyrCDS14452 [Dimorphilus gyrociliatus]|uniref:DgyrCDS14452 n=1 Tax=Dimorphilus gyrociliatus TaxID=2664684 RepID=A0A7I8WDM6_9ANNE|nr:DgyrCDS14452 [Dimorphilus gyrociliatus]
MLIFFGTPANFSQSDIIDAIVLADSVTDNPYSFINWSGDVIVVEYELYKPTPEGENDCPQGSQSDPHLHQNIVDSKTSKLYQISYDVVGQSGQSVFLLSDKDLKVKVEGILKHDYSMHEVLITINGKVIKIKTYVVIFSNEIIEWNYNKKPKVTKSEQYFLMLSKNKIEISLRKNLTNLKILILKEDKSLLGPFLNVQFNNVNILTTIYGGLIGDIGRKNVNVIPSAQDYTRAIFDIDGKTLRN